MQTVLVSHAIYYKFATLGTYNCTGVTSCGNKKVLQLQSPIEIEPIKTPEIWEENTT